MKKAIASTIFELLSSGIRLDVYRRRWSAQNVLGV